MIFMESVISSRAECKAQAAGVPRPSCFNPLTPRSPRWCKSDDIVDILCWEKVESVDSINVGISKTIEWKYFD